MYESYYIHELGAHKYLLLPPLPKLWYHCACFPTLSFIILSWTCMIDASICVILAINIFHCHCHCHIMYPGKQQQPWWGDTRRVWRRHWWPGPWRPRHKFWSVCHQNQIKYNGRVIPIYHDDVIKWKHLPRNWPFVRIIHRSPVNSPHKGQWRGALMFSLICTRINDWAKNREAGDLRRYCAHYAVIVMCSSCRHAVFILRWTLYLSIILI